MNTAQTIQDQFDRDGFVVLRGLLDIESDLKPVESEYSDLLTHLAAQQLQAGSLFRYFGYRLENRVNHFARRNALPKH